MNEVHQSRILSTFLTFLITVILSVPVLAAGNKPSVVRINKGEIPSLIQRSTRGIQLSPTEKAQLSAYYRGNNGVYPRRVPPPRIFELDTTGGPDSFGYYYHDNYNEENGPTYNWIDISGTGTSITYSSYDDGTTVIPIGFSFPFYGSNYTRIAVSTNYWMSVSDSSFTVYNPPASLPDNSGSYPRGLIAPFYGDGYLYDSEGGTNTFFVKYQNFGSDTLVVSWFGVKYDNTSDTMRFEAVLTSTGNILFQYNTITNPTTYWTGQTNPFLTGIENPAGTVALQAIHDNSTWAVSGRAILFYRLGPPSNPIPANNATNVPTNSSLAWSAGPAAAAYNVFFGTVNPPTTQVVTHQNVLTYAPTLASSTSYYWQVISLSDTTGTGNTTASPVWHFTTGTGSAPLAPTNGGIASDPSPTSSSITVTWTDNSSNETGFPIYKMADGDASFTIAGTASANATSYTVTGLNPGTHYTFRMYAANASATSLNFATSAGWTNPVMAGALTLALAGGGFNSIQVASIGADGNSSETLYEVMDSDNEQYVQSDNTLGTTPRVSLRSGWNGVGVNGLTSGTTYHLQAIALNGATPPVTASGPISSVTTNDMSHGGPDGFGYRYITSDAVGGPAFNWETITGTTPTISSGSTDDGYYGPLNLGFTFSFYGTDYTQFYIGTNGYVNFGTGTNSIPSAGTFPLNGWPAGIYYWARDAATTYASAVKYQTLTSPNRMVIEVDGWAPVYSSSANQLDWQMIIYEDGRMIIQYRNYVGAVSTDWGTIGLQTASGTQYNFPFCTSAAQCPTANSAVMFYRLGIPSNPIPADAATAVPTNTSLGWTPAIAALNYNVYFGTANPPTTLVSTHQLGTSYTPTLAATTTYHWKVVAFGDTVGAVSTTSPNWSFTTGTGAAPVSPANGAIATDPGPTLHALTITWTDGADNETGFPITRSTDGTTFIALATAPANEGTGTVAYTDTGLTVNTHYWYRVYAANAAATTTNFATVDGWTLADVPPAPTLGTSGITYATISLSNGNDPDGTQYAIYDSTFNNYLQTNGTLGATPAWQSLAFWGNPTAMGNLSSGTNYFIKVKARNGANVETAYSPTLTVTTSAAMVLPFNESFATNSPWPPYDWQNTYPTGASYYWQYSTNANGGITGSAFFNMYYATARETAILWTPPISTSGVTSAHVAFDWWFSGYLTGTDTFQVVYSLDGGTTYNVFWERYSGGTGGTEGSDIRTNNSTTNYYQMPSSIATDWASTEAPIPAGALGQASVYFGFKAVSGASMYTGSSLGLDNVQIFSVTVPRIGFNISNASFGYRVTNGTYQRTVYVKNTGADTLRITNVTTTSVTPSWTTQNIISGDSALLSLSWHPTTAGVMADTIRFTSNANNSTTARLTVSGNAVDVQNLPFAESFASTTPWPPSAWQNIYPTGASYYWQRSANANGGTDGSAYYNMYYATSRETAILWTPPINTQSTTSAHVSFDWWFSGYLTGTDTFQVVYSLDGGTTYNVFWERYSGGTGGTEGTDIRTNTSTTNYYQNPTTTSTDWASTEAVIPASALGQTGVLFGFKAVSGATMYSGSSLALDNIQIFSVTVPRIGFNMSNLAYGYRVTNGSYTRTAYVKNTGADTLRITNVTATLTPSWTTQSILSGDSAALTMTWHPTTAGAFTDTIHFTSNANNSTTARLTASGYGVNIATLPYTQGFTSSTPWPPDGWQNVYPIGASYYWQYSSNGNGGAGAAYDNLYYTTPHQESILWSPPINTVGSTAVRIDFDWWYSGYQAGVDSFQLVYSTDAGVTYSSFWERYGNGTGGPAGTDLRTNSSTTNYYQIPSSTASEWASITVMVPDSALNVNGVSFGWRTVKGPTMYTGSSLGLDNVSINIAGMTTVGGTVLRADQSGIDSAVVTLVNSRRMTTTTFTNVNGHWTTTVLADTYNISIYKPCMYPNYVHSGVVLGIDSTTRFDGDTVYVPQAGASPTSLEFIVQPGGTASQTVVLTNAGDWPTDFSAQIQYPSGFDKTRHASKPSMVLSPVARTDVVSSAKLIGKKPPTLQLSPSKSPVRQTESIDELNSEVIIGTGTSSQSFPFYNYYWYTRSAMIYTVAELGRPGTIDSIGWYAITAGLWNETTENVYIYMMHTPLTTFTSATYASIQANATLVKTIDHYTGPAVLNDWDMMALDTPFIYNGSDNLMVLIQVDQSGYPTTTQTNTYTTTTGNMFQYWWQDVNPPTNNGTVTTSRPNVRMDLVTFDYASVSPEQGQVIQGQPFELSITTTVPDTTPINTDLSATVLITTNACTTLTIPVMIHVLPNSVQQSSNLPREYKLHQNYPNPFNPTTEIRFDLKEPGMTKLTIYNSLGQVVARLVNDYLPAGYHSVRFRNERAATGVYFYRLESGKFTAMKKMVMVK